MSHPASRRLFTAGDLDAHALTAEDVPALQAFIDANPEYYLMVSGSLVETVSHARQAS